jgi:bifunctional non-homologous end joining protein LigD
LHLDGQDVSGLPLIERKALLAPLIADKPGLQFNGHDTGDGELILKHAGKLGFEGVVSKTFAPYAPGNRGLWRKAKWLNRQEFVIVGWSDPEGAIGDPILELENVIQSAVVLVGPKMRSAFGCD